MRHVTAEEFLALLRVRAGPTLLGHLDRLDPQWILGAYGNRCYVHEGDVRAGDWHPEPPNLIVVGSVRCTGFVDVTPAAAGVDEGGSFWVLGDLDCGHFASYYRKGVFVDGNMAVSGLAVTAFEDSHLFVVGDVQATCFYGDDVGLEAGGRIRFRYGKGYGLPIGWKDAAAQAVRPEHDEATSSLRLKLRGRDDPVDLVARIRAGDFDFDAR